MRVKGSDVGPALRATGAYREAALSAGRNLGTGFQETLSITLTEIDAVQLSPAYPVFIKIIWKSKPF